MLSVCAEAVVPASVGWIEWDVTNHVKDAIREELDSVHLFIKYKTEALSSNYALIYFFSKEYPTDVTLWPKLVVDGNVIVTPSKDTYNSNYVQSGICGGYNFCQLWDRRGYENRILISFPLGSITEPANARLFLYLYDFRKEATGKTIQVLKLTRPDWVESEATWNIYKTGSNWTTAGGDYVAEVEDLPGPAPPVIIDTVPAYSPQSIVNLVFQAGDSAEYPMGKFYVDRMQYSVNTESMRIDARNSIGKYLKDQTFDERNSYEVTKVSDMLEAILSGAGLSDYYVQPNNTYLGMEFAPNKDMLGGIEEVVQYIENWQIREEVSGRVVIADKTSSEFTQPSRYTFRRDRDIFSRDVSSDDRSVYARVCVHTADFSVKVYRPVNTNLGWNAPANKTLYQTVPDGTTSYEAAGIAVKLAESMANSGAIETFVCAFRPQIIPGDEAEILEEDESATMLGIITQVKHSFGTGGFFTEIVVDSGGRIGKPRLKEIIGTLAPPPASKRL